MGKPSASKLNAHLVPVDGKLISFDALSSSFSSSSCFLPSSKRAPLFTDVFFCCSQIQQQQGTRSSAVGACMAHERHLWSVPRFPPSPARPSSLIMRGPPKPGRRRRGGGRPFRFFPENMPFFGLANTRSMSYRSRRNHRTSRRANLFHQAFLGARGNPYCTGDNIIPGHPQRI